MQRQSLKIKATISEEEKISFSSCCVWLGKVLPFSKACVEFIYYTKNDLAFSRNRRRRRPPLHPPARERSRPRTKITPTAGSPEEGKRRRVLIFLDFGN